MYMCKQSIRLAVVEKFIPLAPEGGIKTIDDIYELIGNKVSRKQANEIINSIKICDPAVGSGHFLVSALNEIIAIKSELGILMDENGKTLRDYEIEIVNDELIITDENGNIFAYNPANAESNRVQKTLFHEKQTIIENCLFGVDINPNSVKICRLRLWIELLKNAYYRQNQELQDLQINRIEKSSKSFNQVNHGSDNLQLETLPNIDINIKCGNSLLSRFTLDADLSKALKSIKYDITAYRGFVNDYKNEKSREVKRGLQKIIDGIKADFRTEINKNDPKIKKLDKLQYELNMLVAPSIFKNMVNEDMAEYGTKENIKKAKDRQNKLETEVNKLAKEIEDIKNNVIYRNAFEWRFEFPEVMNNEGDFEGFDLIIGNPPYISALDMSRNDALKAYNKTRYPETNGSYDIYILFLRLGIDITNKNGTYSWIVPNKLLIADYAVKTFDMLKNNGLAYTIDVSVFSVFKGVGVYPIVVGGKKNSNKLFNKFAVASEIELTKEILNPVIEITTKSTIKDLKICVRSGTTGFEAQKIKAFVNDKKNGIRFTVSGNIDRYNYNNINVRYMNSKYETCYIQNDKSIAVSKWKFWNEPKIVVAGMTKVIEAVFVEDPLAIGVGCYAIYDFAGINPKAIVGVLNSKYLSYYLNIKFKDKHLAGGYLAINKSTIEQLPFVNIPLILQNKIAALVDKIISQKQQGEDTKNYENQIDKLVYQLYDITEDEQKLIENK
ncbi:MAG: hypothetical protein EAZ15_01545 [Sphingobacteriales bacterium]|nr:MAG: hypothetical protein EAZ15_01545 [Sphingobacteriales bacterium]